MICNKIKKLCVYFLYKFKVNKCPVIYEKEVLSRNNERTSSFQLFHYFYFTIKFYHGNLNNIHKLLTTPRKNVSHLSSFN